MVLGLMLVAPQLPNAYNVAAGSASPIYLNLVGINIPIVGLSLIHIWYSIQHYQGQTAAE